MVTFLTLVASALIVVPAVLAEPFGSPAHLYARQISGFDPSTIPTSCQTQCQSLINTVTNEGCSTLQCLCTNTVTDALDSCMECAVGAGLAGLNQTTVDQSISGFVQACNEAGFSVTALPSTSGSATSGSATSGSGSSGSGSTTAAGAASTSTGASTSPTKSGAVIGMGISIVGSIVALALGGVNFA